ncbi:hypothetical protein NPX13_g5559 [Xylaria arbuscula]|uniref:Uncharacterized protein n=1 Tax=Xylaria arbuscula TaxID=114810 RepID=A0A9W8TN13_9PEZI|nr:hypothetical protein NPX13_g5559 [Xylaria arbuscula]
MWTELSYSYRLSPSIEGLMPLAMYLRDLDQHPVTMDPENESGGVYLHEMQLRERAWVGKGLRTLSEALTSPARRHKATLLRNPALIWKDEIRGAQDRHFWPSWPEEEEWIRSDSANDPTQHSSWRPVHDNPPTPSIGSFRF